MNTFDTIVEEWIEHYTGISLDVMDDDSIPVISSNAFASKKQAIIALKFNDKAVVIADPALTDALSNVVNGMHSDLLFSQFGVYELARATHQYGATPSGPSWYLFADKDMWHSVDDDRPVRLSDEEMNKLYNHPKIVGIKLHNYWHNLEENDINIILENNKKNKPVYVILKYQNVKKIKFKLKI